MRFLRPRDAKRVAGPVVPFDEADPKRSHGQTQHKLDFKVDFLLQFLLLKTQEILGITLKADLYRTAVWH